jgi:RsmE family RNA methyltransferase
MNLILLDAPDFISDDLVCLTGRRFEHVAGILQKNEGATIRVGRVGGLLGQGTIINRTGEQLTLRVQLDQPPPPALALTLILALPRPKMLRRILQTISALGVKHLYLINSYRVDKSYWNSPLLTPAQRDEHLRLGLEQARDTILPQIQLRPRFKPFVEDELPDLCRGLNAYVAHPGAMQACPQASSAPALLVVGPEGGFIPYEVDKLQACGTLPITLGPRILRVETALPVLLARLVK